jgi:hypothetical protein
MMFDPKKHSEDGGGGGDSKTVPAGDYVLAATWLERKVSKAGAPYLRVKFQVVGGPLAGRSFFAACSLNQGSPGAMKRLATWCAFLGQQDSFDLGKDSDLRRVFLDRPFAARVALRTEGGFTNNDIERYTAMSSDQRRVADGWVLDRQESAAMGGRDDDEDQIPF